jgi:hypothetical protein
MRIRAEREQAVGVVERRSPDGATVLGLMLTLPAVTVNMMRTMSLSERFAWLAWTWAVAVAATVIAARRKG